MKVYRVVTDRDGADISEPGTGKKVREIDRREFRYAAETMQQVWDAIDWLRNDPEETLIAVIEEHPAIEVLRDKEQP